MAKVTSGDVRRWIDEAAPALRGGFLHRIWRDGETWRLLVRHHEGGDPEARAVRRVVLEADLSADFARCVAVPAEDTDADDKRAKKAQARDSHPFLALLRRQLTGARVEAATAVEGERIVFLDVVHDRDDPERDGPPALRLVVELIGKTPNVILAARDPEEDHVRCLGSLHAGRSHRPFEPGTPYRLPPPRPGGADDAPALHPDVEPDPETLALGQAVAETLRAAAEEAEMASRHGQLRRAARKGAQRLEGVVRKLEQQLEEVAQADEYERQGDLLKANLTRIPKGAKQVEVEDYPGGATEPVRVLLELDPTKTPQDEMKALYKRAKKLRSGEAAVQQRLGETDQKLEETQQLLERIEATAPEDEEALDAIEQALRRLGALPKQKGPKPKVQVNQGPRSFRTREGHEVLVGRSDEENDRLTMRVARGNDLFFHVRGCPGSHVILRVDPNRPPNHESLLDAASLAVHYSKARNRGNVDVSYTPRKWVKKPRGAKPGLVQISNEKTVRAGGDPERLQRVLDTLRREEE